MRNPFLVIWIVLILASCGQKAGTENVTGTYQRTLEHEAYTLYETVVITKDEGSDARYLVKSQSVTDYKDKKRKLKERTKPPYTCLYDPANKILQAPDPGLSIYFDDKLESFRIGSVTFTKKK